MSAAVAMLQEEPTGFSEAASEPRELQPPHQVAEAEAVVDSDSGATKPLPLLLLKGCLGDAAASGAVARAEPSLSLGRPAGCRSRPGCDLGTCNPSICQAPELDAMVRPGSSRGLILEALASGVALLATEWGDPTFPAGEAARTAATRADAGPAAAIAKPGPAAADNAALASALQEWTAGERCW